MAMAKTIALAYRIGEIQTNLALIFTTGGDSSYFQPKMYQHAGMEDIKASYSQKEYMYTGLLQKHFAEMWLKMELFY